MHRAQCFALLFVVGGLAHSSSIAPPPPVRTIVPFHSETTPGASFDSLNKIGIGVALQERGAVKKVKILIPDWDNTKERVALLLTVLSPGDLERFRLAMCKATRPAFSPYPGGAAGTLFAMRLDFFLSDGEMVSAWLYSAAKEGGADFSTVCSHLFSHTFHSPSLDAVLADMLRREPAPGSPRLPTLDLRKLADLLFPEPAKRKTATGAPEEGKAK